MKPFPPSLDSYFWQSFPTIWFPWLHKLKQGILQWILVPIKRSLFLLYFIVPCMIAIPFGKKYWQHLTVCTALSYARSHAFSLCKWMDLYATSSYITIPTHTIHTNDSFIRYCIAKSFAKWLMLLHRCITCIAASYAGQKCVLGYFMMKIHTPPQLLYNTDNIVRHIHYKQHFKLLQIDGNLPLSSWGMLRLLINCHCRLDVVVPLCESAQRNDTTKKDVRVLISKRGLIVTRKNYTTSKVLLQTWGCSTTWSLILGKGNYWEKMKKFQGNLLRLFS